MRKVLLVDDDADSCEIFQIILERAGHVVVTVSRGQEAIDRLLVEHFDVAVVDLSLPDVDGYEVARTSRERLGARAPRFVAATGFASEQCRAEAKAAGFDAYLLKPLDSDALVMTVATIVP